MKINISNVVKAFSAILFLGILAVSCGKDPIFFLISTETAPIPPRIPGSPTNMVVFERTTDSGDIHFLFVASGRLHWYGGTDPSSPGWDRDYGIPQPGGKVIALAVTNDYLYALCLSGSSLSATLRRIGKTGGWNTISNSSGYSLIQSIYSTDPAEDRLFAGARKDSKTDEEYGILYLDGTTLKTLRSDTKMLSGAAFQNNNYYLCTREDGIFKVSKTDLSSGTFSPSRLRYISRKTVVTDPDADPPETKYSIQDNSDIRKFFMGMIKLGDTIIAIERDGGALYEILTGNDVATMFPTADTDNTSAEINDLIDNAFIHTGFRTGSWARGGLALWVDSIDPSRKVLVASRQGTLYSTSYNNGYIEFGLISSGSSNKVISRSDPTVTVKSNSSQYSTSLEKHPINHLFQAPFDVDSEMTFFASTQTGGLWSFRNRSSGGWQWNAED